MQAAAALHELDDPRYTALIHGDISDRNCCLRNHADGTQTVLTFDWELAHVVTIDFAFYLDDYVFFISFVFAVACSFVNCLLFSLFIFRFFCVCGCVGFNFVVWLPIFLGSTVISSAVAQLCARLMADGSRWALCFHPFFFVDFSPSLSFFF